VGDAVGRMRSVLVLGGTSDIAKAIVRRLVARGTEIVILGGRSPESSEAFARELKGSGARTVEAVHFDAGEIDKHQAFADQIFDKFNDIDSVLVAFGTLGSQDQLQRSPRDAADTLVTNYVGAVSVALAVANRMQQQGHGTLVFFSSVAGVRPRRSNFIYGSSKAALDFFARGLAESLRDTGVRVMIVRPGFVSSKMTTSLPHPPLATDVEHVAAAVVRGFESRAGVVWVPSSMRWLGFVLRALPPQVLRRIRF